MTTLTEPASARSRLFQLIALGFTHPVEAFHRLLLDGSYSRALAVACSEADSGGHFVHVERQSFADFEARYIELFQMGRRGKPLVALNAGDHASISQGETNCPCCSCSPFGRGGYVVSIRRLPVTNDLGQNGSPAFLRIFQAFHYQHPGAFTDD